jgi:hypothetical protein
MSQQSCSPCGYIQLLAVSNAAAEKKNESFSALPHGVFMHLFYTILTVNSGCFTMQHQLAGLCIGDSEGGNEVLRKIQMGFSQCEGRCGVVTGAVSVPALRLVYPYTAHLPRQCHN